MELHPVNSAIPFTFIMILLVLKVLNPHMDHFSEIMLERHDTLKSMLNYLETPTVRLLLLLEIKTIMNSRVYI